MSSLFIIRHLISGWKEAPFPRVRHYKKRKKRAFIITVVLILLPIVSEVIRRKGLTSPESLQPAF